MHKVFTYLFYGLLLLPASGLLAVPAVAQSESDGASAESSGGDQPTDEPIGEPAGERTLEQECNEHGVDWHSWAEKVTAAVWGPLIEQGTRLYGQTLVKWTVTSDCHVHIISVQTADPDGTSGKILVAAIKALDGKSLLAFPRDTKKTVVEREARVNGRPIPHFIRRYTVYP